MRADDVKPWALNFPPAGGQVDYAAIAASWVFNSNWMGL